MLNCISAKAVNIKQTGDDNGCTTKANNGKHGVKLCDGNDCPNIRLSGGPERIR
jgi:hypothetical protein